MINFFSKPGFQRIPINDSKNHVKFIMEPFVRGYATTFGNGLRRTLLSSIPSYSAVGIHLSTIVVSQQGKSARDTGEEVRVAKHELDVLDGIYEDVSTLILNVKALTFKMKDSMLGSEELLEAKVEGATGEVRAKDLVLPAGLEVVDPEAYIFKAVPTKYVKSVSLKINLRQDRGYWLSDQNKKIIESETDISTIPIDTDFSPIVNVRVKTNRIAEGDRPHEGLELTIETNGAISADSALAQAILILQEHLSSILSSSQGVAELKTTEKVEIKEKKSAHVQNFSLEELELDKRTLNALKAANIHNFVTLIAKTEEEIKNVPNLGAKSIERLKAIVESKKASFK